MNGYKDNGLLPQGVRDDLPPLAGYEAHVVERLMRAFLAYGYERVTPPLVEFEETLLTGPGGAVASQMFRLMDPVSQRMMGVRPDMTLQIARIAATRLSGMARPARLSYAGQALRVQGTQLRPEREIGQVGAELVGGTPVSGNAELIVLAAEALTAIGVNELSIDMTLPRLVPLLCEGLGIAGEAAEVARAVLDAKDAAALAALDLPDASLLQALLSVAGPAGATLTRLEALELPAAAQTMCHEVAEVVALVRAGMPNLSVTLDPCESRGFEYHTGLGFTFFAKGARGELGRGGRYVLKSGEPAAGFTLYMDSVLRALPPKEREPLLYLPCGTVRTEGVRLRRDGWRTVHGLDQAADSESEARRLECSHIFVNGAVQILE